jgi:alpha-beta hydrolase superfamily lysophospholipase
MGLMMEAYSDDDFDISIKELPVLFLSGEDDTCMGGPSGLNKAVSAVRDAGCRNVMIKTYPAMRHEILNEIGKERVWQDIYDFMRSELICRP